jgi:hypothetical protein
MPQLWIPDVIPHLSHEYNCFSGPIEVLAFLGVVLAVITGIFTVRFLNFLFQTYIAKFFPRFAKIRVVQCMSCSTYRAGPLIDTTTNPSAKVN